MLRLILVVAVSVGCFVISGANGLGRIVDPTIINVDDGNIGPMPYQAAVEWRGKTLCGASVIGAFYAATAAHCVGNFVSTPNEIFIRVGSDDLLYGGRMHRGTRLVTHPGYTKDSNDYDIALVKVGTPFHPKRILELSDGRFPKTATVSGWGAKEQNGRLAKQLQWAQVPLIEKSACLDSYQGTAELSHISPRMLCAGGKGKGVCSGDDGGPLVSGMMLIGIVAWFKECAGKYPDLYIDVSTVKDWINREMEQTARKPAASGKPVWWPSNPTSWQ